MHVTLCFRSEEGEWRSRRLSLNLSSSSSSREAETLPSSDAPLFAEISMIFSFRDLGSLSPPYPLPLIDVSLSKLSRSPSAIAPSRRSSTVFAHEPSPLDSSPFYYISSFKSPTPNLLLLQNYTPYLFSSKLLLQRRQVSLLSLDLQLFELIQPPSAHLSTISISSLLLECLYPPPRTESGGSFSTRRRSWFRRSRSSSESNRLVKHDRWRSSAIKGARCRREELPSRS